MTTFDNPKTPFLETFVGNLKVGKTIQIEGTASRGFAINFNTFPSSGKTLDLDSALQIDVQFSQSRVTMNSRKESLWQREEMWGRFPFVLSKAFTLQIAVEDDNFKMSVDGQHMYSYVPRGSVNSISHLSISDGVAISKVVM